MSEFRVDVKWSYDSSTKAVKITIRHDHCDYRITARHEGLTINKLSLSEYKQDSISIIPEKENQIKIV